MKSYKSIAEAAGTTVEVVREAAKTVYEEVTGWRDALDPNPWHYYRTKGEALEAIAKRKQAELDKAKAEREAIKADTEAAYKLMTAAGYETHGDTDKTTAIVSSLKTVAHTKGVTVSELTVDDFHTIARKDCLDTPAQNPTTNTVTNNNEKGCTMKDYEETLSSAIANAEYYSTDMNAIYGDGITGVVTEKTFTPEQIARYNLPKYMAWNTGTRAEYDASEHEYVSFNSLQDMADYINEESPLIEDEE